MVYWNYISFLARLPIALKMSNQIAIANQIAPRAPGATRRSRRPEIDDEALGVRLRELESIREYTREIRLRLEDNNNRLKRIRRNLFSIVNN